MGRAMPARGNGERVAPAPILTRSMLLNKHEGPDEIEQQNEKFQALMAELRGHIEVLSPTIQERTV